MLSKLCVAAMLVGLSAGEGQLVTVGDRAADLLQVGTPNEGLDVPDWCNNDNDCRRLGDVNGQCQDAGGQSVCVCTNPYIGELCYEPPTNIGQAVMILGTFVITFPEADCSAFRSINGALAEFDSIFERFITGVVTYYLCGSLSMVAEGNVAANNISMINSLMMEQVATAAAGTNYSAALQFTGSLSTVKTSFHPDPGPIPTCIILNAQKTIIVEDVCRPLICNPGYIPYDEYIGGKVIASCELDTEGDDAALSDSAIAGIIFGTLLLCAMVAFIIWHFARPEPENNGIPVNEPFGDNNPENVSTCEDTNEPYGKDGHGETPPRDESRDSDIAV